MQPSISLNNNVMKLLPTILLPIVLLLASCRIPDEVGIGSSASQYDMLGASQQWPLTNDQGQGFGVNIWASWNLAPKKFVMITPEREYNPFERKTDPIVLEPKKDKPVEKTIGDQVKDISSVTKDMTGSELVFWVTVLCILALTAILVIPRVVGFWKSKKSTS